MSVVGRDLNSYQESVELVNISRHNGDEYGGSALLAGRTSLSERRAMRHPLLYTLYADTRMMVRNQEWTNERAARVERLKAQVRAGTYHVDSTRLAEKILKDQEEVYS